LQKDVPYILIEGYEKTFQKEKMSEILILDAVGIPKKNLTEFGIILLLSPFIIAFVIVLFFRLLDRISPRKPNNK